MQRERLPRGERRIVGADEAIDTIAVGRERNPAAVVVCAAEDSLRSRIVSILDSGNYAIADSTDSVEAVPLAVQVTDADVVVISLQLEPFAPVPFIDELHEVGAPLVAVVSGFVGRARKLARSRLHGVVWAIELEQTLIPTIEAVLAEQLCVPSEMREELAHPVLSHREKQVLELLIGGLTNGQIAERLYLSESTVKSHLASSFRKLGVSSRAEAVKRLLSPDAEFGLPGVALAPIRPLTTAD